MILTRTLHFPDDPMSSTYMTYKWAEDVMGITRVAGHNVIDLAADRATRENLEQVMQQNPDETLYVNFSHGFANRIVGQRKIAGRIDGEFADYESLVDGGNVGMLSGKLCYIVSCKTARDLGQRAVMAKARAYIGYTGDFTFGIQSPGMSALGFKECAVEGMYHITQGRTAGYAVSMMKDAYKRWITHYYHQKGPIATAWAALLKHNSDGLVLLGNPFATW